MIDAWVKSRRAANDTDYETWIWGGVSPTLNAFDNATETRVTVIAFYSSGGGNDAPAHDISPTVKVGGSLGIPSPPAVAYDEFNDSTADIHHTLRAGTRQATGAIQDMKVRRLTPRECERLQGFPDDWTRVDDRTADSHRYKQMGNAVTVNVAAYIGALIMGKVTDEG